MEDLNAPDVKQWVEAENAVTFKYLDTLPIRDEFRRRITELWNYPKVSVPFFRGRPLVLLAQLRSAAAVGVVHAHVAHAARNPSSSIRIRFRRTGRSRSPVSTRRLTASTSPSDSPRVDRTGPRITCASCRAASELADTIRWVKFSGLAGRKTARDFSTAGIPNRRRARRSRPPCATRRSTTTCSARPVGRSPDLRTARTSRRCSSTPTSTRPAAICSSRRTKARATRTSSS